MGSFDEFALFEGGMLAWAYGDMVHDHKTQHRLSRDEAAVVDAVLADPICRTIVDRAPQLGLTEWWLTAGAVFQNVWNAVEHRTPGYGINDYDLFYCDGSDLSWEAEDRVILAAAQLFDDVAATIEVRNEARVHLWYEEKFGMPR